MAEQAVSDLLNELVDKLKEAAAAPPPVVAPPPPPPPKTPEDLLLDAFVDGLTPANHKWAAVPFSVIEVSKADLRSSAEALLRNYDLLKGGSHA